MLIDTPPIQALSIVITTHKAVPYLRLCLDSINRHRHTCEVVIYCDGSPPETAQLLKIYPWARFRLETVGVGIPEAGNRAAALAKGEYLFFVNDDMVFPPRFETLLLESANTRRVVSATCIEPPIANFKSANCFLVHDCGTKHDVFNREAFEDYVAANARPTVEPGVNYPFLVSRKLFFEIGGFDTRFRDGPLHDPDFFYRLKIAGAEMLRRRDVLLYHFSGRSLRFQNGKLVTSSKWRAAEYQCIQEFLRKWGERPRCSFGQVPRTTKCAPLARPLGPARRVILAAKLVRAAVREWQRRRYRWALPPDAVGWTEDAT